MDKINGTKNALFFLSRAQTHHSFTNLRFLDELKFKVLLSKTACVIFNFRFRFVFIKDTHREEAPSKTPTLSKIMNKGIWVVGTSNQFFVYEVLKLKQNFRKNKEVVGKTQFFVIGPLSICDNIGF